MFNQSYEKYECEILLNNSDFVLVLLSHFVNDICLLCEDVAFFDLIAPLSNFWQIILLVIVAALVASSVNSSQIGTASVVSSNVIVRVGVSDRAARWIDQILLISINIPAVILSLHMFDVVYLFLIADFVCASLSRNEYHRSQFHSCTNRAGCILLRDFVCHCCSVGKWESQDLTRPLT